MIDLYQDKLWMLGGSVLHGYRLSSVRTELATPNKKDGILYGSALFTDTKGGKNLS